MKLKDLNPCRYSERIGSTTRKEWDKSTRDAMWLVGKAHSKGSMSRRTLVSLTLKTIEPIFPLMPFPSRNCMAQLSKWVDGDDSVDLKQLLDAADAAAAAARATDAAIATAYTAAHVAAAAYAAADAFYCADRAASRAAARKSDQIDVRKHITCDECCVFLGIEPDEVLV